MAPFVRGLAAAKPLTEGFACGRDERRIIMASAINHKKRSHRSEKFHWTAVNSMQKFAPRDYLRWLKEKYCALV